MGINFIVSILASSGLLWAFDPPQDADFGVFGDSQIQYSHYLGYQDFLKNIKSKCPHQKAFQGLNKEPSIVGFGASGTTVDFWLREIGPDQNATHHACRNDEHRRYFDENTTVNSAENRRGAAQKFAPLCRQGRTPLQGLLESNPKVVVANFLGNHTNHPYPQIKRAFDKFANQLPEGTSCVIITSPSMLDYKSLSRDALDNYKQWRRPHIGEFSPRAEDKADRDRNITSQNIVKAVKANGRCQVVDGTNKRTRSKINSDPTNYVSREWTMPDINGGKPFRVPDFYHLSKKGSLAFFETNKSEICKALGTAYSQSQGISNQQPTQPNIPPSTDPQTTE